MRGVQYEMAILKRKSQEEYLKMKKDERLLYLESTIGWLRSEVVNMTLRLEKYRAN